MGLDLPRGREAVHTSGDWRYGCALGVALGLLLRTLQWPPPDEASSPCRMMRYVAVTPSPPDDSLLTARPVSAVILEQTVTSQLAS